LKLQILAKCAPKLKIEGSRFLQNALQSSRFRLQILAECNPKLKIKPPEPLLQDARKMLQICPQELEMLQNCTRTCERVWQTS
jgi:hypothetical protein